MPGLDPGIHRASRKHFERWITGSSPVMTRPKGASVQHPFCLRAVEREGRHVDLEFLATLGYHLVAAGHEARRGRQRNAAGIFEALAGGEHRLFADHPLAADFLLAAGGIRNDPVPRAQLHGLVAGIGDGNGVGPEILPVLHGRALREEVRLHGHFDIAGHGAVHTGSIISLKRTIFYPIVSVEPIVTGRTVQPFPSPFHHSWGLTAPYPVWPACAILLQRWPNASVCPG